MGSTRMIRAKLLQSRLQNGPSWHTINLPGGRSSSESEALALEFTRQYQNWARTWILDSLQDLVPELRKPR